MTHHYSYTSRFVTDVDYIWLKTIERVSFWESEIMVAVGVITSIATDQPTDTWVRTTYKNTESQISSIYIYIYIYTLYILPPVISPMWYLKQDSNHTVHYNRQ